MCVLCPPHVLPYASFNKLGMNGRNNDNAKNFVRNENTKQERGGKKSSSPKTKTGRSGGKYAVCCISFYLVSIGIQLTAYLRMEDDL